MSVLTVYPSVDGQSTVVAASSWSILVAANGNGGNWTFSTLNTYRLAASSSSDLWNVLERGGYKFDTSALTSGATISAAVFSVYGQYKEDDLSVTPSLNVYGATIAGASSDYQTSGTTAFATAITYANQSTGAYNDLTLNATGIAAVSKTGDTSFCTRSNYDATDTDPTWSDSNSSNFKVWSSAKTGTTNDPKLVVTYTASTGGVTVEPAVLETTLSIPAPTITATQFITVEPSVLELTLSQPAPTVVISGEAVDVTVEPTVLGITLSQPVPTVTGGADITTEPSVLELTLSQPDPTVTATENVTIELTVLGITLSQPAPTVVTTESVTTTPAVLATSLIINAPTVTGTEGVIITPSVLETNLILNAPTVITEVNTTVTPNVLETVLTTNAPTVIATRSVTAKPGVASLTLSVNAPLVIAAKLITLPAITSTNHGQEYVIKDTAFTFDNDNVKLITTGSDTLNKGIEMCLPKEGTSIVVVANNNVKDWEIKSLYYAGLVDILIKSTTRITTTYTILVTDDRIFADTDGGAFTVTLPAGVEGQEFRIINCGSSGNDLTIAPNGAENLTGANASKAASDGTVVILTYNATEGWW